MSLFFFFFFMFAQTQKDVLYRALSDVAKGAAPLRYYYAQLCDHHHPPPSPGYLIVPLLIAALFTSPEKHADGATKHQF